MSVMKAAIFNPQSHLIHMRAALFHSTAVLERKRRNHWQSFRSHEHSNSYSKRFRKMQSKKSFLNNISAYAEHLFQLISLTSVEVRPDHSMSWKDELDEDDPSSSKGTSWFNKQYVRPERGANQGRHHRDRRGFQFCEDEDELDFDVDKMFRSSFGLGSGSGRKQHFYWSFIDEEDIKWRSSFRYSNDYGNNGNRRFRVEEEDYEYSSTESESSNSDMSSYRQALGLSVSGPLKLKDVKNAYRACALKWHPDRHQGSSKVVAEEKFKLCSQAYQSICDKLAVN
ncbi:hypothetical protein EZV62_015796 [Acer yangbiense]|uniref:J domain-containing protein n=1 Tax=Acer yangbiense TaxID=1000413 RepID=A0A5C7HLR2_9ROSI|nr:hypothetical protein EZV62_015796 [Acer yangbiense]